MSGGSGVFDRCIQIEQLSPRELASRDFSFGLKNAADHQTI
jgi:putative transposase